jgi:hypothetical protein
MVIGSAAVAILAGTMSKKATTMIRRNRILFAFMFYAPFYYNIGLWVYKARACQLWHIIQMYLYGQILIVKALNL